MNTQIITLDASELRSIPESKASKIKEIFEPMSEMLAGFEEEYAQIMMDSEFDVTNETCKKAKELRLKIAKVRTNTETARKKEKEEHLRAGKAVDGVANILKWAVTGKEDELKKIENHFELKEQERLDALQYEREVELEPFITEDFDRKLCDMEEDVWQAYLNNKKTDHKDRLAAEDTARQVREAQDKEDAENLQRIEDENKKLKDAADAVAAQQKIKDDAEAVIQKKKDDATKKIADENQRLRNIEVSRKLKEQQNAKEAERLRLEDIQAELSKGDAEKIEDLRQDLVDAGSKYRFKAEVNVRMYNDIARLIHNCIRLLPEGPPDEDVGI